MQPLVSREGCHDRGGSVVRAHDDAARPAPASAAVRKSAAVVSARRTVRRGGPARPTGAAAATASAVATARIEDAADRHGGRLEEDPTAGPATAAGTVVPRSFVPVAPA